MLSKQKYGITYIFFLYLTVLLFVPACSTYKEAMKEVFEPEASFRQANDLIKEEEYEDAREILETIKAKDASQKYAILARLRIADTYFEDESYEEAAVEYESFLNSYQYHKYTSYAQYKLAMSFFKRIKTVDVSYSWAQRALEEFEKLQRRHPRNPYMDIIDSRIKKCKSILAEYEFYVGSFYYEKGSYKAAIQRFNGMIKDYPDSGKVSEAFYYIGLSYENLGQRDKAISFLTALIEKFPATELSKEAKELINSFDKEK
jgi:outer membrane protein assembly factor BamD